MNKKDKLIEDTLNELDSEIMNMWFYPTVKSYGLDVIVQDSTELRDIIEGSLDLFAHKLSKL